MPRLLHAAFGAATLFCAPGPAAARPVDLLAGEDPGLDIVVTARRREERAQDVPIALSVVSGETIERTGTFTLVQIADLTPSLVIRNNNARNTFANIRGLGSNANQNDGLEIGVGFYIDDVYYGRIGASQFDLIDIERFEVLRGPQGTLFGKNTTAGAINITTRAPTFEPEFYGEASLGNFGFHQVRGSVSGPLVDGKLAARLTVSDTHQDGFLLNRFNGRRINDYDNFLTRAQLLAEPTENLRIRLIADWSRQTAYSRASSIVGVFTTFANGARINNNFLDRAARAGYVPPFDLDDPFARVVDVNAAIQANMEGYGVSMKADWTLPVGTLTSITAYRWWDWYPLNDQDDTSLTVNVRGGTTNLQRQFSQELRLASETEGPVSYVVGLYYFWQVIKGLGQYQLGPDYAIWNNPGAPRALANFAYTGFQSDSIIEPRTSSYAAFGQLVWTLSDRVDVTGGLRVTYEEKTGLFDQFTVAGNDLSALPPAERAAAQALRDALYPETRYTAALKDAAVTGLLTVSWRAAPDVLVYGTYARGEKSGGLSLGDLPDGASPVVDSEGVNNLEGGVKTQWLDRRLTVNLAAWWTEVSNYQAAISETIGNTTSFVRYIANIPGVRSRGFELDLAWAANDHIRLSGAAAYTDAVYQGYTNAQAAPERRNESPVQDLSGVQLANAPRFLFNLAADLDVPIDETAELHARIDYNRRSSNDTSATNSIYTRIPAYGLLNARLGVRLADGRIDVEMWARNLLDKRYFTALGVANNGLLTGNLGDPRLFGVTGRLRF